jgi:mersacidin/lichenicidin family type 2 lantibiotic
MRHVNDTVRAWKDPERRDDLTVAPHPSGEIQLSETYAGSAEPLSLVYTVNCCDQFTVIGCGPTIIVPGPINLCAFN